MRLYNIIYEIWNKPAVSEIVVACIVCWITHLLDNRKARIEQKLQYRGELGRKVADSLIKTRELVSSTRVQDVFFPTVEFGNDNPPIMSKELNYPAFMSSRGALFNYCKKFSETKTELEPFLSRKISSRLSAMELYLLDLAGYIKNCNLFDYTAAVGVLVIFDIVKWQRKTDQIIVKELNKSKHSMYSKTGLIWSIAHKKATYSIRKDSVLDKLMNSSETQFHTWLNDLIYKQKQANGEEMSVANP